MFNIMEMLGSLGGDTNASLGSLMQNMGDLSKFGGENNSPKMSFNWQSAQNYGRQYAAPLPNYGEKPRSSFINGIDVSMFVK